MVPSDASPAERLPSADLHQRADDGAHHLVAEGVGRDLEAQQAAVVQAGSSRPRPSGPTRHPADQRGTAARRRHLRPAAERGEVVLADQRVAGQAHHPQVEGALDVPGRRRPGTGPGPPGSARCSGSGARWPRTGRRTRPAPPRPPARRWPGRTARSRCAAGRARSSPSIGRVEGDDLPPRVDAGVGPPGPGQRHLAPEDRGQSPSPRAPATVGTSRLGAKPWKPVPS